MFFKKKTLKKLNVNNLKQEIMNWTKNQNVDIKIEVHIGDFRDGMDDKIEIFVFFETNSELEKYKENFFISKLRAVIIHLLNDYVLNQEEQIIFAFDVLSNRNLYFFQYNKF